jgi:hypothetical protein
LKWQLVAVVQAEVLVAVHRAVGTEKVRQVIQVEKAVTQVHNHIQEQVAAEVAPL